MAAFIDAAGNTQQFEVTLETIRDAGTARETVRDYINGLLPTNVDAYGDSFSQLCASEGLVLNPSKKYNLKSPSIGAALNGRPTLEAGAVVRNPSNQARVLLMPVIGALTEDKLAADLAMNANAFDSMIAIDTSIADDWLILPVANYTGPEAGRSQVISQLAKPVNMLVLTTSEKAIRIPTYSLGIEYASQAENYLNLDFIALSIARQVAIERNERANQYLLSMVNGDADVGQGSLAAAGRVKTAVSLDSTSSSGITQKAWMLWLFSNGKQRRITHVVTDVLGMMAIQNRSGRPVITGDNGTSTRFNTNEVVANPTWNDNVSIFITDDANWPSGTVMGLDSRYAIQRVTSSNANYNSIENFVTTRSTIMRFDTGSICRRLYDTAFDVLTYA